MVIQQDTRHQSSVVLLKSRIFLFPTVVSFHIFFINAATVVSFSVAAVTKLTTWISICRLPVIVAKLQIRITYLILNK